MVKVILRGGLGNQMFQYAAGLDLALKNKTQLILDATYLNDRFPRRQITYRVYDLDIFELRSPVHFTTLSKISGRFPISGMWLGLDLALSAMEKSVIWGFYQGEKYFIENREAVRNAFRFKHPLEGEAARLAQDIANSNSVSLHVRRGDYVNFKKVENLMGATNLSYYEKAIEYISARIEDLTFFIFSDDIDWCKKNLKVPAGSVYLERSSEGPKASFHLELMSLCKHNIIANSSFSWWGAWLNRNPGKIIIGPARWQNDGNHKDVLPDGWVAL